MASERFQPIRAFEHSLELAVKPVDAVTGRPLRREVSVSLPGEDVAGEPTLSPSDYWVYRSEHVDLSGEAVEVAVAAGREYVDATYTVALPDDGAGGDDGGDGEEQSLPAAVLPIHPNEAYVFGPNATLVVGDVEDAGDPVGNAIVTVANTDLRTRTDADGRFVLPIQGFVPVQDAGTEPLRFDPEDDEDAQGDPKAPTISVYDSSNGGDVPTVVAEREGASDERDVEIPVDQRTALGAPLDLS